MQKYAQISLIIAFFSLCACSNMPFLYRPPVQQGNITTQEMLAQVKPGMSSAQVRYIMGTPILVNTFNNSIFNYVYTFQAGRSAFEVKRVILYFSHDRLVRVSSS